MRSAAHSGHVYRRCGCRDQGGKQLGAHCPELATDPNHGTWTFSFDLPSPPPTIDATTSAAAATPPPKQPEQDCAG
ncbi:hypothetical protein [Kitasatospora sp. NPDC096204]|uniref:hypothetical protein n=1 Tax=Kitasatospora sp. NPDC096204 TaxID=3364094 RepID=UPI003825127E